MNFDFPVGTTPDIFDFKIFNPPKITLVSQEV